MRIHQFLFLVLALFSFNSFAGNAGQPATGAINNYDRSSCLMNPTADGCPTSSPPEKQIQPTQETYRRQETSGSVQACENLRSQMAVCYQHSQEALLGCQEEKDSDLQATVREVRDKTAMADRVLTNQGLNGGCGVILKATNAVSSAYLAFQQSCNEKRNRCISTCTQINEQFAQMDCKSYDNFYKTVDLEGSLNKCHDLKAVVDQGSQFAQDLPGLMKQAAACQAATNGQTLPALCATNPTASVCQNPGNMDCNDPTQATSVICACRNGPNTTACQAAMNSSQKLGQGNSMTASSNSRLQNADSKKTGMGAPDFGDLASEMAAGTFKPQPGEDLGGRMGGSANVGGGGGGSGGAGAEPGGDGTVGISTNVNGGFGRGGGGGGSWGGGRAGSGSGSNYGSGSGTADGGLPNLNKFRPQMGYQNPRRDLAGVVGPDGLLGPHANFWQTIKNRYNYEWRQGTLKP